MHKNKIKIIILIICVFLVTGCTKNFVNEETKKSHTSNILCKPETKELQKIYEENADKLEVKYNKLKDCKDFKINTGGYEGLWTSIFVKPLSWLILKIGIIVKNYGISIMLIGFFLRLIMYPLSKKSTSMNKDMQKMQPEMQKLEKKYKDRTDKESQMMKQQEMMMIYKKYNVSPGAGCIVSFIQIPLLFAFYEAIQRVPVFFEETLWKFHLGTTPYDGMIKYGNYWYIIIIVLIIATTYFSFKNVSMMSTSPDQAKQTKMMSTIMVVFVGFMSFTLPTALGLYWIVSSGFTILQNYLVSKTSKK